MSDKMGEIGFINLNKVNQLPVSEEESKNEPFEENGVYKTLYGHQEGCLGFQLNDTQTHVLSVDQLKKVVVTNFPNVFNLQSVMLEHTKDIQYACFMGTDKVASLSEPHNASKKQDLMVSSAENGKVLGSLQVSGSPVISMAAP